MLALAVGREPVGGRGRIAARPRAVVPDVDPDAALLHAAIEALEAPLLWIEHPDRRVVGVEQVAAHDLVVDPIDQGLEHLHRAPAPIDQRAVGNVRAHAREDLGQAVERQMVVEFGDQNVGQQGRARHAARDRAARGGLLHHLLAAAAGLLQPRDLEDLQLRHDHVEDLADVLAYRPQVATAVRAAGAGVEFAALARGGLRHARAAAGLALGRLPSGRRGRGLVLGRRRGVALSSRNQQVLQRQLELFDLALDLLRGLAEGLLLQLRDAQPVNRRPTGTPDRRRKGTPSSGWHTLTKRRATIALRAAQGGRSPTGGARRAKRFSFGYGGADQLRFLNRQLSLPVSTISQ